MNYFDILFARYLDGGGSGGGVGVATLQSIKGNTLVWNQLVQELSSTYWVSSNATPTFADNSVKFTATAQYGQVYLKQDNSFTTITGHKYLFLATVKLTTGTTLVSAQIRDVANTVSKISLATVSTTSEQQLAGIYTENNGVLCRVRVIDTRESGRDEIVAKNIMIFDLTKMFGGNEPTADEFRELFPLPYYDFDSGSLLNFTGTGIKTTGFNLWDEETRLGYYNNLDGAFVSQASTIANKNPIRVFPNTVYYCKSGTYHVNFFFYDGDGNYLTNEGGYQKDNKSFTTPANCWSMNFCTPFGSGATFNNDICVNLSSSKNGTYEPYKGEETLSLPTSAYFPTGMKSARSVYDELTTTKATTRIGSVDLGTLTWTYEAETPRFYSTDITSLVKRPVSTSTEANIVSSIYTNTTFDKLYMQDKKNMTMAISTSGALSVINTTYSGATAFKTAMSGVILYYELDTPTETATSLNLTYDIEWNGTEQLLPVNTSDPTTSPILAGIEYPDGERTDQEFTFREIQRESDILNDALNIILNGE